MATKRITTRVLAGLTLAAGLFSGRANAQQKIEDVLARRPVQPGVVVSTPTGADLAACKAEQMSWPKGTGTAATTGTVVKDAQGRLVRQFVDTTGRNSPNIFSYYVNGVEAYRESDTKGAGRPDQYRWLGPNGGKWGADANGDGVIDQWYVLSAEELSQELLQAVLAKDARRLAPLLPTEAELKQIGLPAADVAKIMERAGAAGKKLADAADALKLGEKAKWVHLEVGVPQTTPGDSVGNPNDVVVYKNATVLVDRGDGKAEVFQTGEMILVGRSWRLIDGPTPGAAPPEAPAGTETGPPLNPAIVELVKELDGLPQPAGADAAATVKHQMARAAILEKIVALTQGAEQVPWVKQVIDAYTAAAEAGDGPAMARLKQWQESIAKAAPTAPAAAYAAFRLMAAEYTVRVKTTTKQDEVVKLQGWWREQLEGFVKAYPQAEDTPDAMIRLAVAQEFTGKDGEAEAKKWYERLAKDFPTNPYAAKATGAVKRLASEGQPFQLAGPTLGTAQPFDTASLAGKPYVVYYWASWGGEAAAELKQLAELAKTYGPKGLEVVTVNLDDDPAKAVQALNAAQVTGTHLHAPGGLDKSPLGAAYGIMMVPHVFTVGKDGKVVNKNAQTGTVLKDEIEKLTK